MILYLRFFVTDTIHVGLIQIQGHNSKTEGMVVWEGCNPPRWRHNSRNQLYRNYVIIVEGIYIDFHDLTYHREFSINQC